MIAEIPFRVCFDRACDTHRWWSRCQFAGGEVAVAFFCDDDYNEREGAGKFVR